MQIRQFSFGVSFEQKKLIEYKNKPSVVPLMRSLEVALLYLRQLKAHNLKQIHNGRGRVVYTVLTDDFFIYVDEKVILEEHVAND